MRHTHEVHVLGYIYTKATPARLTATSQNASQADPPRACLEVIQFSLETHQRLRLCSDSDGVVRLGALVKWQAARGKGQKRRIHHVGHFYAPGAANKQTDTQRDVHAALLSARCFVRIMVGSWWSL